MRSKWILPTLVILTAALVTAPASAQTIAYINALQFDLQSFRNQATAGVFVDDIDKAAWAARLLEIDGYRVYTNLSNLNDPALMGDRLITYGLTQTANPTTSDNFDCGSFLFGTTFRFAEDSDYVHSIFFQDAGRKTMFESLDDYNIGTDTGGNDAEFKGNTVTNYDDGAWGPNNTAGDQIIDRAQTWTADLKDYEQRQARRIDLGTAKDVSQDLSAGARVFYEKDQMDLFTEGSVTYTDARRDSAAAPLLVRSRQVTDYYGPGEEAYKNSRIGVSLDADYHPWANQSVNVRLDIAKQDVTNPGANKATVFGAPELPIRYRVDMGMLRNYTVYTGGGAGFNPNPYGDLTQSREWRSESSFTHTIPGTGTVAGPYSVESVDDEGGGIALGFMGEYRRECYGGQSEAWLAYIHAPYDLDATIVMRNTALSTAWWNSGSGDFEALQTTDQSETISLDGDRTYSVFEAGARWTKPLSSKVEFGGSLIATLTKWTEDYRQTTDFLYVSRFDDGDATLGNDAMEGQGWAPAGTFQEEELRQESTDIEDIVDETKSTVIRIPFGIRFRFAQKWTWNMGSIHEIAHTQQEVETTVPDQLSSQGVQTYTDYDPAGAHNVTTSYEPSNFESGTETVTEKYQSSTTTFFYGLEWHATENLWFYINGMFEGLADGTTHPDTGSINSQRQISDVEFYRSLSISAKILL
jgi:hypothetical protein